MKLKRSEFERLQRRIAHRLEGTTGPERYAGKDRRYSKREAERSAAAIAASIGRRKLGSKGMAQRAAQARRRKRRRA